MLSVYFTKFLRISILEKSADGYFWNSHTINYFVKINLFSTNVYILLNDICSSFQEENTIMTQEISLACLYYKNDCRKYHIQSQQCNGNTRTMREIFSELHGVHLGYEPPPSSKPPSSFTLSQFPLKSADCPNQPFKAIPPYILVFPETHLKIGHFRWSPIILKKFYP